MICAVVVLTRANDVTHGPEPWSGVTQQHPQDKRERYNTHSQSHDQKNARYLIDHAWIQGESVASIASSAKRLIRSRIRFLPVQ